MSTKRKNRNDKQTISNLSQGKQQFAQARQAHAKGTICMEDYIWTAMQCYAADMRAGHKSGRMA